MQEDSAKKKCQNAMQNCLNNIAMNKHRFFFDGRLYNRFANSSAFFCCAFLWLKNTFCLCWCSPAPFAFLFISLQILHHQALNQANGLNKNGYVWYEYALMRPIPSWDCGQLNNNRNSKTFNKPIKFKWFWQSLIIYYLVSLLPWTTSSTCSITSFSLYIIYYFTIMSLHFI